MDTAVTTTGHNFFLPPRAKKKMDLTSNKTPVHIPVQIPVHIPPMDVYVIDIEREERGRQHESVQSVCCSRRSIGVLTFLVIVGILILLIISEVIPEGYSISFRLIIILLSVFLFLGCMSWVVLMSLISENCVF